MKDYENGLVTLKQDIMSLIVTFETNFNKKISSIHYDSSWLPEPDNNQYNFRDVQIYLEEK